MVLPLSGRSFCSHRQLPGFSLLFPGTLTTTALLYFLPTDLPRITHKMSSPTIYNTAIPRTWSRPMLTRASSQPRTGSRSSCSRPTAPRVQASQDFPIRSGRRYGRSTGRLRWHTTISRRRSSTSADRIHTTILLHPHRPTSPRSVNGPSGRYTTRLSSWPRRWARTMRLRSSISQQTLIRPFMPSSRMAHRQRSRCLILLRTRQVRRRTPPLSLSAAVPRVRTMRRLRKCKSSMLYLASASNNNKPIPSLIYHRYLLAESVSSQSNFTWAGQVGLFLFCFVFELRVSYLPTQTDPR
jgi:hypothetical protein